MVVFFYWNIIVSVFATLSEILLAHSHLVTQDMSQLVISFSYLLS